MQDLMSAQRRLHRFVDLRFALPASQNILHSDIPSTWAHDNVVLDWDSYAMTCRFPYCDQFDKKSVIVRLTEFLAVAGGLWSTSTIIATGVFTVCQSLLGLLGHPLDGNRFAWVPR